MRFAGGTPMELFPAELRATIPPLYASTSEDDPIVQLKFFAHNSDWTWYVIEGMAYAGNDFIFFGWVVGLAQEMGYFRLSELWDAQDVGVEIERDAHFTPCPLSQVKHHDEP